MIEGSDPISTGVFTLLEVGPKDGIVDDIHKGCNGMPAFVVKPHLQDTTSASERHQVHQLPKSFLSTAEHPFPCSGHISSHILPS